MTGKNDRKYFSTEILAQDYIKSKKVLFRTEDGVDIYERDNVSTVLLSTMELYTIDGSVGSSTTPVEGFKYFSTKGAAKKHILLNKPCLSIQDVIDAGAAYVRLKKIVKERLWKS